MKMKTAIAVIAATALSCSLARAEYPYGWVTRSMREMDELRAEQERERAELAASQDALDASRRELAAIEMNQFMNWMANGEQGFCPIQFDMRLPNPGFNTPEMQAFFRAHPEAVRPCNPTEMMVVPTPEMAATMLQLAQQCQNDYLSPALPFVPPPRALCPRTVSHVFRLDSWQRKPIHRIGASASLVRTQTMHPLHESTRHFANAGRT